MAEQIDNEVEAIKAVLNALEPLSPQARSSVIEYVLKRLGVSVATSGQGAPVFQGPGGPEMRVSSGEGAEQGGEPTHIRGLKDTKKPRSANEMAALVAYYLSDLAPSAKRKKTINSKDIETYFKIAGFRLPEHVRVTLPNAKAAGYFDAVGEGEYRLNAVGHNLVVHSMPRGSAGEAPLKKRRAKKARPAAKKR